MKIFLIRCLFILIYYRIGCAVLNLLGVSESDERPLITLLVVPGVLPVVARLEVLVVEDEPLAGATETASVTGLFVGPYFCASIRFKSSVVLLSKGFVSVSC
jgi:hypothetical protein